MFHNIALPTCECHGGIVHSEFWECVGARGSFLGEEWRHGNYGCCSSQSWKVGCSVSKLRQQLFSDVKSGLVQEKVEIRVDPGKGCNRSWSGVKMSKGRCLDHECIVVMMHTMHALGKDERNMHF